MTVYAKTALDRFRALGIEVFVCAIVFSSMGFIYHFLFMFGKYSHELEMVQAVKKVKSSFLQPGSSRSIVVIQTGASYCTVAAVIPDKKSATLLQLKLNKLLLNDRSTARKWRIVGGTNGKLFYKTADASHLYQTDANIDLLTRSVYSTIKETNIPAVVFVRIPSYLKVETQTRPLYSTLYYKWYRADALLKNQKLSVNGSLQLWPHFIWIGITISVFGYALFTTLGLSYRLRKSSLSCEEAVKTIRKWQVIICFYLPLLMLFISVIGLVSGCLLRIIDQWCGPSRIFEVALALLVLPVLSVLLIGAIVTTVYKRQLSSAIQLDDPDIAPQERDKIRDRASLEVFSLFVYSMIYTCVNLAILFRHNNKWIGIAIGISILIIPMIIFKLSKSSQVEKPETLNDTEPWIPERIEKYTDLSNALTDKLNLKPYPVVIRSQEIDREKLLVNRKLGTVHVSYAAARIFTDDEMKYLMAVILVGASKSIVSMIPFVLYLMVMFLICILGTAHLLKGSMEMVSIPLVILMALFAPVWAFWSYGNMCKQALKLTGNPDAASSALRKKVWWQTSRSNASVLFDQDYIALRLLKLPCNREG